MSRSIEIKLSEKEFELFKKFIHKISGIQMKPEKKVLIESRLAKRLRYYQFSSYRDYYDYLLSDDIEQQMFIDIITTNETSFFREPHHFEYLKTTVLPTHKGPIRIWSAACSIGAEAYSTAMVCDDVLGPRSGQYEIVCTDINADVVKTAQIGLYPEKFIPQIPQKYLKKHCMRGNGKYEGNFIILDQLKSNLLFRRMNLLEKCSSDMGEFDVIFLRNMLIYFDAPEKKMIVENVISRLKHGGYLFIGHSESLFNISNSVTQVKPTIYRKP
jgi:chemotaxis protein methyltransferase CheR